MENIQQIKENIELFITSSNKYEIKKEDISIDLKRIGGYSNTNFFGIIKNKSTNVIIENIFYREYAKKFEALSDSINHEEEIQITKLLAEKDYGPKFLFEVKDSFCITQFITDTKALPREKYFDKNIIEQLCTILNYFTSFSYVYKYEINNDSFKLLPIINTNEENKKIHSTKNQYQKSIRDLYDNSKNVFNIFYKQFIQKYSKEKNPEEYSKIELVKYHLDNYKKIYNENSLTKGFYVINHNDVLDANILYREKDDKIFLIDHEYFILNLPGHDIAYYIIESFFYNEPEYKSELNKVDFDKLFPYYEVFINKFI